MACFQPSAFLAVISGHLVHWTRWVFFPFWPLLWWISYLYTQKLPAANFIFKNMRLVFMYILLFISLYILIPFLEKYKEIIIYFVIFILSSICMLLIYIYIRRLWQWRIWIRRQQASMTCQELWQSLAGIDTLHRRIMEYVREHHLLVITKETEEEMRNLTLEIEQRLNDISSISSKKQDQNVRESFINGADDETLDELYLLLEDIRASLQKPMV
jgi:hypothetical protein